MPPANAAAPAKPSRLGLAIGAAVFLALAAAARQSGLDLNALLNQIDALVQQSNGPAGAAVFIASYAAATVLLFPASVLTLGAGYVFGAVKGTAVVSAASTAGATASFLLSRYALRPYVEERAKTFPRFTTIDAGVAARGWQLVLLLRLSPLVPFGPLNYALGLTRVPLPQYVAASWAGMLPATAAYVYFGSLGRAAVDTASTAGGGNEQALKLGLYAVGAVAALAATKLIADAASQALDEPLAAQQDGGDSSGGGN